MRQPSLTPRLQLDVQATPREPGTASPRLPLEILELIVGLCDRRTQLNVALVCRALICASRQRTFAAVKLNMFGGPAISLIPFASLLDSSVRTIIPYVRQVTISNASSLGTEVLRAIECAQSFPNITSLRLEWTVQTYRLSDMGPYVSRLPGITDLSLHDAAFGTFSALTSTVSALPNLQNLTLAYIFVTDFDEAPPQQDERVLAKLRSVECYDGGYSSSRDPSVPQRLFGWLSSLRRPPPLEHVGVSLRVADVAGTTTPFGDYLSMSGEKLTSLAIFLNPRDLARNWTKLDFAHLSIAKFRSVRVEGIDVSSLYLRSIGEGLLRLLSFVLSAPVLRTITIHVFLDATEDEWFESLDKKMNWAALERLIVKSHGLAQVSFEIDEWHEGKRKCTAFAHRVRELLPITREGGILQIRTPDGEEVRGHVV
ncbi:uncharacterized protein SCHCODRAFT_02632618 [Schizophyllum commune H4-8]|uniref:uncharacterized protein n=1 Tax=Schizophyllum commune (strain H4-8 / FGSC 9210) TaxID=578458 RepID=UPI00215E00D4|nr:uncharacterized protein SCHCODRAFT_02632618 [Schizophyllum commune H4-8]KAI5890691.1 hypothetical protein SCHCODRAFT_02632618 [Schizophyllum commune H4-8]